jgi:seryl-tRNA synthetase
MTEHQTFLDRLFAAGILLDTGVDGLYGRSAVFEDVIDRFERAITRLAAGEKAERLRFPPGMNRADFETSGYIKSFPQLAGTVHSFDGDAAAYRRLLERISQGHDWTLEQKATDIVFTPAACYPLYPVVSRRGHVPHEGCLFDLCSYCFRHEPSQDPTRMQLFRMREFVRFGSSAQVMQFRETWIERGKELMGQLQLPVEIDLANDVFFGRTGQLMIDQQRAKRLKFELLIPVTSEAKPTACLSFNYHEDHFGELFGIHTASGERSQTACVGFGLERVALALFRHHGLNPDLWPRAVREILRE